MWLSGSVTTIKFSRNRKVRVRGTETSFLVGCVCGPALVVKYECNETIKSDEGDVCWDKYSTTRLLVTILRNQFLGYSLQYSARNRELNTYNCYWPRQVRFCKCSASALNLSLLLTQLRPNIGRTHLIFVSGLLLQYSVVYCYYSNTVGH